MSPEDDALFQQAKDLYNVGKKRQAYHMFFDLYLNNRDDTSLLCWIGYSTPDLDEAQQALASVERLNPNHPSLPKLRERVDRLERIAEWEHRQKQINAPLEMTCPYCHYTGPARTKGKVSVGGWIWFSAFFLLFVACWFLPIEYIQTVNGFVPADPQQAQSIMCGIWGLLAIGCIGFFFRKRRYVCGQCGIALGDRT